LAYGFEAASQSWKAGSLLIATAGKLTIAAQTSVAVDPAQNLVAVVHDDATDTLTAVMTILPGKLFEVSFDKASDLGNLTLLASHQWAEFGFSVSPTGIVYLDSDRLTTNAIFRITEFVTPVGTVSNNTQRGGIRVRGHFTLDQTAYEAS